MAQPTKNGKVARKRPPAGLGCVVREDALGLDPWRWECCTTLLRDSAAESAKVSKSTVPEDAGGKPVLL